LQQNLGAPLFGEDVQVFNGGESGIELTEVILFIGKAQMKNEVTKREELGNFDGALDLIHGGDSQAAPQVGNGNRQSSRPPPIPVAKKGRVQGMESNGVVAEPLRYIAQLVRIVIVQMLAGGHDFEITQARGQYLVQGVRIEPFLRKQGGGESIVHQYPTAFP